MIILMSIIGGLGEAFSVDSQPIFKGLRPCHRPSFFNFVGKQINNASSALFSSATAPSSDTSNGPNDENKGEGEHSIDEIDRRSEGEGDDDEEANNATGNDARQRWWETDANTIFSHLAGVLSNAVRYLLIITIPVLPLLTVCFLYLRNYSDGSLVLLPMDMNARYLVECAVCL